MTGPRPWPLALGRGRTGPGGTLLGSRAPWWPCHSAAVGQKCACVSARSQVPSGAPLLGTKEAMGTHLTALKACSDPPVPEGLSPTWAWLLPHGPARSLPSRGCQLAHPSCRAGGDWGPDIFRHHQPAISTTTRDPNSSKLRHFFL